MSLKIILTATLFSIACVAQANDRTKNEIVELARQIRQVAPTSESSDAKLTEVRSLLEDALDMLQSASDYKQECFKFSYEKYYIQNGSDTSTTKAATVCKTVTDVGVLKLAYEKYYIQNGATTSMDKAAVVASKPMNGKLDMLQFAYEKYYIQNGATTSMDKASEVARAPRGSLSCLTDLYTRYYAQNSATVSMDKAIEACAN